MLAANVPYLEVDGGVGRRQGDGRDVLADGGHGPEVRVHGGVVRRFDLFEERRLARIVEPEEEDGVFCSGRVARE